MIQTILTLFLMLVPILASAQDSIEMDGISYSLNRNNNEAFVTRSPYNYEGEVVIPESFTYDNVVYNVTSIGFYAFQGCTGLTSITIPNSVTTIEGFAFQGCTGLTSITLPNSLTGIGREVFSGCTSLTSITIPSSVTMIWISAFQDCTCLSSINIPNSVTVIGSAAFKGCTSLMSVTSNITEPYSINSDVFSTETYRKGTLYIPAGTEKLYTRFDGWREFLNIMEIGSVSNIRGDLNNDGKVDAADVVELVNIIMNK